MITVTFVDHAGATRTVEVPESRVVILEGIYALSARLRPLMSASIITLPAATPSALRSGAAEMLTAMRLPFKSSGRLRLPPAMRFCVIKFFALPI